MGLVFFLNHFLFVIIHVICRTVLRELVFVGEFPLPQSASPPFMPGGHTGPSSQKRSRDSDAPDTHPNTPNTTSSSIDSYGTGSKPSAQDNGLYTPSTELAGHDQFRFSDTQSSYYHDGNTLNLEQLSLPSQHTMEMPQNMYGYATQQPVMDGQSLPHHTACDVLTALDSAYLVDSTSSLGDGVVMDVAQHAMDVWGSAPTGFQ